MRFVLHQSHRLEDLFDALVRDLAEPALPPLATETILVPGRGVAKWLQLQLAQRLGIAAGLRLPFLGAFLQELAADGDGKAARFDKEVLVWRLARLLEAAPDDFGPAAAYLEGDQNGEKRFQLSQRLAACFDDYQLYRDDLLLAWAGGDNGTHLQPHGPWQARVWRALLADAGLQARTPTPARSRRGARRAPTGPLLFPELQEPEPERFEVASAHRLQRVRELLADPVRARAVLPPRLSVFGATTLPPAMLGLLQAIATHVPVRLYVPQPTPHYVGDLRERQPHAGDNPLLALFGQESRECADALSALEQAPPHGEPLVAADAAPETGDPPRTLLACLQHDLVAAHARDARRDPFPLRLDDESLRVHDCHSIRRELEVVRDRIFDALAADQTLEPHDILVLVPSIDAYAPVAHAVFAPTENDLPFLVADRNPAAQQGLCRAVLEVLELALERLTAWDVLHLLEEPAVHRRFQLTAADVPPLRRLCERAGIRWGLDGSTRAQHFGLPSFEENRRHGIERLVLGTATGPIDDVVLDTVPVADRTESRQALLENFLAFTQTLFPWLQRLRQDRALASWADELDAMSRDLFADEPKAAQAWQLLQATFARLRTVAGLAEHSTPVSPRILRDWLVQALEQGGGNAGFLGGSLTIAAMLPMRTVPVRCLFVCGLDDASFPRRDHPAPFDLIAAERRRGDRSVRLDDRQLFLDLLLAARQRLHLTFVGHSAKDNSPCAPSVVVSELLDHIDRTCTVAGQGKPREAVCVEHPLQPWSARYRGAVDPRIRTWANDAGIAIPAAERTAEAPWCPESFAVPTSATPTIELADLLRFWRHPCRYFLREALHLHLHDDDDAADDNEPFVVDHLARYLLADDIVQRTLRDEPPSPQAIALARAHGRLPVGSHGDAEYRAVADHAAELLGRAQRGSSLRCAPVQAKGPGFVVVGQLDNLTATHLQRLRPAKLKPKDRFAAWILHLVMSLARCQGASLPPMTSILTKDGEWRLPVLGAETAQVHLANLVAGYQLGSTRPLAFFERASFAYGEAIGKGKAPEEALRTARKSWIENQSPDDPVPGDVEDPAIRLCFRGREPLAEDEFARLAERLWVPLIGHLQEVT